ncbi:DUF3307 domain-containing protein [Thermogemmatispora onikobensis]|uniref:DUF3307 domain-containing protein n=1 Tax=Thermogemmatispora onikobensis TaxID=732234 RepID=UPI000853D549|nr:DUF3307 domain-containing protein [Thermogemmatispora onikobensis]
MVVTSLLSTLFTWLACHFVGDFAFQSSWMALEKGKSWEVAFYHCATYTAVFVLFARPSVLAIVLLLTTHLIIDALKARYHIIPSIWVDQLLHLVTIALIVLWGL